MIHARLIEERSGEEFSMTGKFWGPEDDENDDWIDVDGDDDDDEVDFTGENEDD